MLRSLIRSKNLLSLANIERNCNLKTSYNYF